MIEFNRHRLVFGLFVLALIVITEFVTGYLKLPAWPAYTVWVLFFIEHMDARKAPHILVGAIVGLLLFAIAPAVIGLLAQVIGVEWGNWFTFWQRYTRSLRSVK